jgi:anthranilate phosphoribosyltransferase
MPGLVDALGDAAHPLGERADFLIAWAVRGETPAEVAALAAELRNRSVAVPLSESFRQSREILDVCGTGGDRLNTFNISTTVALVCAAAGVPVAKHGSVSVSSLSGAADVLRELGVAMLPPALVGRCVAEAGIAFMFAPLFHPALKHVVPVRKAMRMRTVFNLLGPLLSPCGATSLVLGVFAPRLLSIFAEAVAALDAEAEAEAEAGAGAGAGDAAQQGAVITAAQWARMCEDGARAGF